MPKFDFIEDEGLRKKAEEAHQADIDTINSSVDSKINEAVTGLKTKNEELIGEKKKIQKILENFKDLDPEKAREAMQFLEQNENARLLKEGKVDELLAKQTSQLKTDYEDKLKALGTQLDEANQTGQGYKGMFETKTIEDAIRAAAIKAGVRPEALQDVVTRGLNVFTLGEDLTVEARDKEGNLRKLDDDIIMTPKNWAVGLKSVVPHYWPDSEGAGAGGGGAGGGSDLDAQLAEAAKKNDHVRYRKLRAKQKKAAAGV